MKDSTYELAKSIFAQAYKTDNWNAEAFAVWRLSASTPSWNRLEVAWQEEGCPKAFSWPILKEAVEASARSFCSPPLEMLGAFLYSPDTQSGYEGYWLDWQTDEVKADIYRTAQTWMEQAALGLNEQAWILLRIAISSKCMPQWRGAPEKCVSEMDWYTGMRFLNTCSLETLTVPDIERIPFNNVSAENTRPFHNTLIGTMLKSCDSHWRTVARCIEDKAGPGLWLTYVLSGDKNVMEAKRKVAWNNMKLDGVDAWAMSQFIQPAASFEQSFDGMLGYKPVLQYKEWAHQWWMQCVLGMDSAQALDMVRSIHSGVRTPESFEINAKLLFSDNCAVS